MLNQDKCWDAVQKRDASQDGKFFFGVLTTGVYCRPSCPSRPPLRKNVRFFESSADAEREGLRPCLRCRPLAAKRAGLSLYHFQRSFKAIAGVTPGQYLEASRLKNLKRGLRKSKDVTEAVYEAGYGSSSRVYERADTRLGMTPNQYRQGGRNISITYATFNSPLGVIMVGATDRGLCFLQFGDTADQLLSALQKEYPSARIEAMREPCPPEFQKWMDALTEHLKGGQPHLDLPLDIRATAFQMRVWNYLQSIPYGEVQSYGEVASGIGLPNATRAVARACATNTVALVIPCHRVIRGTGQLGGYRWGLDRKRTLIDRERATKAVRQQASTAR